MIRKTRAVWRGADTGRLPSRFIKPAWSPGAEQRAKLLIYRAMEESILYV
jgi:hypothetical protein